MLSMHKPDGENRAPNDPPGTYWKYPFTSRMKCVVLPFGWPSATDMVPPAPRATIALLARVCPARKLMVEARGAEVPPGKRVRNPIAVGPVTVTLMEMAFAVGGIWHCPPTVNVRVAPPASAGPP